MPKNPTRKWIDLYKQRKMVRNPPISSGSLHYAAIDSLGILYMAGRNESGQLGDGTLNNSEIPIAVKSFTKKVISVSCGNHFTMAITEDGKTYGWGSSKFVNNQNAHFLVPTLIDVLKEHRAIKVSCRGIGWAVILDIGSVYYRITLFRWGYYKSFTRTLSLEDDVIYVSAGAFRLAMVTKSRNLYFLGDNFAGVGVGVSGTMDKPVFSPVRISLPLARYNNMLSKPIGTDKIQQVSLGNIHIMVLTTKGTIFTWGENNSGQLGIGAKGIRASVRMMTPQKITTLPKISYINADMSSSSAITMDGRLYVWGVNSLISSLTSHLPNPRKEALKLGIIIDERGGPSTVHFPMEIDIRDKYQPVRKRLRINYVALSNKFSIVSTEDGMVNFLSPNSLLS